GFYTGFEMRPIEGIHLEPSPDGLPRVLGRLDREGLRYDFEYFAAPLVLGPAAPPEVDVVRVKITNGDSRAKVARLWAGLRGPDAPGRFHLPDLGFHWSWDYEMRRNVVARDFQVVAVYPLGYADQFAWPGSTYRGRFGPKPGETTPENPVALARYDLRLEPGGDTTLAFYYPGEPSPDSYGGRINSLSLDTLEARYRGTWEPLRARLPRLELGDARLADFVTRTVVSTRLQERSDLGPATPYANKNLRPFVEILDIARIARLWRRLGLTALDDAALQGARTAHGPQLLTVSARDGRAATAALVGLACERALARG